MDLYWEIQRLRALQKDTPHFWEQQSGFLRPVDNYPWIPEPSNTIFAHQNEIGRCVIYDGNHPSDQCIYCSEWQNFWNHSWYEEPPHFTEPCFPSYPPLTSYDLHQEPEPSEECQMIYMLKDWLEEWEAQIDAQFQRQA